MCTTWTAHDFARTPRVPQSKPTSVHSSPPLVHRHEPRLIFTTCRRPPRRILHLHITSQKILQIHTMLSITPHPRATTINPHFNQFLHATYAARVRVFDRTCSALDSCTSQEKKNPECPGYGRISCYGQTRLPMDNEDYWTH